MALTDKLTYIADAVRSKTSKTAEMTLEEIEATIRGSLAINPTPSYITAEAQRVAGLVDSANFNIISGTDVHLYSGNSSHDNSLISAQYAGMGIKELQKRIPVDCIAMFGDYSYMTSSSYTAHQVVRDILLSEKALDVDGTEIWCVGNHDWCYGSGVDRMLTADELYEFIGSKSDGVKPTDDNLNRCYGYIDFPTYKIRVIYLNTNDCKDGIANGGVTKENYNSLEMISPTQFRWVADVALNFTESGWGVIFASHHPLDYGYGWFTNFLKMLEAYQDGTNLTLWLTEYIANGQTIGHNETFNFASYTNRAEIICNIHGHVHNCGERKVSSADGVEPWLWRFCVPNMCANRYNEKYNTIWGEVDANGNRVQWVKETGNAKATSFNVISIDRANKMIYAYTFGAGKDRAMYYGEYIPIEYTITANVSNCVASSSNPTTITEGLSASLKFTASSGYELPDSITVSGAEYTWNKSTGTLALSNPTANVSITIVGVEIALPYINQIPISTDKNGGIYNSKGWKENTYLSSGNDATKSGCGAVGFIPIGTGSSTKALGEQVIYLENIEALPTDTYVRIVFYDSSKTYIFQRYATQFVDEATYKSSSTTGVVRYTDANGYINKLDVSGYTAYLHNSSSYATPAFFRICAPGIDGDSIITVNEEIV